MKLENAPKSANSVKFPKTNLNVRVLESKFGNSKSSGNPMITLDVELTGNSNLILNDGSSVDVNGLKHTYYIPFTAKNAARLFELYKRLGIPKDEIPVDKEINDTNKPDPKEFDGLVFNAAIGNEEIFARQSPKGRRVDPESGAELPAEQVGELIMGPDGKSISQGFRLTGQWTEIYYVVDPATIQE